ncbi:hypothetical protein IJG66_01850 [Candidatus Saccharibacteria bacterium]|nr:hypothetical protein [Candidatus Saccharibacteria bacterium]
MDQNNSNDDIFNQGNAPATPTTPETPAPAAVAPAKKSKKGLAIGLSVGAVVLLGGAAAGYTVYRNQPAVIASDAVTNVITAKNLGISGTYDMKFGKTYADQYGIEKVTLTLEQSSATPPAATTAKIDVKSTTYGNFSLKFSDVIIQDGVIYLKLDGVEDTIDTVFDAYIDLMLSNYDYLYENCASTTDYGATNCYSDQIQAPKKSDYEKQYRQIKSYFSDTIELADGTWWKISPDELINTIDADYGIEIDNDYSDAYKCIIENISNPSTSSELGTIYRKNQFVNLTPYTGSDFTAQSDGNLYSISVDAGALVDFTKDVLDSNLYSNVNGCLSKIEGFSTVKASDISDATWDNYKTQAQDFASKIKDLYVEVDGWSHQLRNLYFTHAESGVGSVKADFKFSYDAPAVSAPSDSVDVADLLDTIYNDYNRAMRAMSSYYNY